MTGINLVAGEDFCVDPVEDILIYENDMYRVVAGSAVITDGYYNRCYRVENKLYDMVEMETTVLMRALFSADDYETHVKYHTEGTRPEETHLS